MITFEELQQLNLLRGWADHLHWNCVHFNLDNAMNTHTDRICSNLRYIANKNNCLATDCPKGCLGITGYHAKVFMPQFAGLVSICPNCGNKFAQVNGITDITWEDGMRHRFFVKDIPLSSRKSKEIIARGEWSDKRCGFIDVVVDLNSHVVFSDGGIGSFGKTIAREKFFPFERLIEWQKSEDPEKFMTNV